ncbi:hypothetical protein BgiMline_025012, partial [Biomphalaria glabrata]
MNENNFFLESTLITFCFIHQVLKSRDVMSGSICKGTKRKVYSCNRIRFQLFEYSNWNSGFWNKFKFCNKINERRQTQKSDDVTLSQ